MRSDREISSVAAGSELMETNPRKGPDHGLAAASREQSTAETALAEALPLRTLAWRVTKPKPRWRYVVAQNFVGLADLPLVGSPIQHGIARGISVGYLELSETALRFAADRQPHSSVEIPISDIESVKVSTSAWTGLRMKVRTGGETYQFVLVRGRGWERPSGDREGNLERAANVALFGGVVTAAKFIPIAGDLLDAGEQLALGGGALRAGRRLRPVAEVWRRELTTAIERRTPAGSTGES